MPLKSAVKKAGAGAAAGKRKKLSFAESAVKAAAAAVQTTHVNAPVEKAAAHAPPAAAALQKKGQQVKTGTNAAKKRAVAGMKLRGIVKAKRSEEDAAAPHAPSDEEISSDDEDDMLNSGVAVNGDANDLSDTADRAASTPRQRDSSGTIKPYRAVRLSFLPPEFQEPQLYKFLNQFGATVLNCFCVRSKRSHRSRGIAYVAFDKESVIPLVVEECNGMALGGMSVRARAVTMRRPMPSRQMVARRRALAYAYRTKGTPLKKHDVRRKDPVALLLKAARTEEDNNRYLQRLGIDFKTDFFKSQLATLPPGLRKKRRSGAKKPKSGAGSATGTAKAIVTTTHVAAEQPLPSQQASGEAPTPKAPAKKRVAKKVTRPAAKRSARAKTTA
ncbi:hypothetical protein LSCM1_07102 [Leishmania martiniquensis]|uniref:RRM domain-containing protein n=1 Tax=Leishmania martiniquensis TaxID=1580590 RepID=A0A836GN34_9TRYP|nr:hypothetical protein LSCM1_07102 [Leishmania martiniquensis]